MKKAQKTYQEVANMFIASGKSMIVKRDHGVSTLKLTEKQSDWLLGIGRRVGPDRTNFILDDGEIVGWFTLLYWPAGIFLELRYIDDEYKEAQRIAAIRAQPQAFSHP